MSPDNFERVFAFITIQLLLTVCVLFRAVPIVIINGWYHETKSSCGVYFVFRTLALTTSKPPLLFELKQASLK